MIVADSGINRIGWIGLQLRVWAAFSSQVFAAHMHSRPAKFRRHRPAYIRRRGHTIASPGLESVFSPGTAEMNTKIKHQNSTGAPDCTANVVPLARVYAGPVQSAEAGVEATKPKYRFTFIEQEAARRAFSLAWPGYLSKFERYFMLFLLDSTIANDFEVLDATWDQLEAGVPGRPNSGWPWYRPPIGMSRATFFRTVKALSVQGAIHYRAVQSKCMYMSVNWDWDPNPSDPTTFTLREVAERLRRQRERAQKRRQMPD